MHWSRPRFNFGHVSHLVALSVSMKGTQSLWEATRQGNRVEFPMMSWRTKEELNEETRSYNPSD